MSRAGDPGRWARMRAIFEGALAHAAPDRARYVERACAGEGSLLADVRTLLDAHEQAGAFLDSPVVATAITLASRESEEDDASRGHGTHAVREGQILSHYRLDERLGAGGMGVVYRAHDLALGRDVAVKILPDTFTPALRDRLRAEADACARLQHPAIATYHHSGDWDGTTFIAMELVRGQTLRRRLRDGPLPPDEAMGVAACVLEAISHAHAAGILHRDIKPENIIVTGDRSAKLLDFGLAMRTLAGEPDVLAHAGRTTRSITGTIGYMSPEQIRDEPLDERSDVFQTGAVLYEMIAGRPAFAGATIAQRLAAVLTQDPAPLDHAVCARDLYAVIARALDRDPARRYPSAGAMLSDLLSVGAGECSANLPDTLAVLDLRNLTGSTEDEWIGSGMAESLSTALARSPGVTLASRDQVLRARVAVTADTIDGTAVAIGQVLGCRWVLTGEHRRIGQRLHLTTRLVEAATGRIVATQDLDGTLDRMFDLQDRIVTATCARLAVETAARPARAETPRSAYELYARGRELVVRRERGAYDQAQPLFEQAVRIDAGYAEALAGLAQIAAMRYTFTTQAAALDTAIGYARRAMAADPLLAESYIWLGYALMRAGREEEAAAAFARCRVLDPREVSGYYFGIGIDGWRRHPGRSLALMQEAVGIDPHFGLGWWVLGAMHLYLGRHPEASACFERSARVNTLPVAARVPGVGGYWAECLRRMHRLDDARAACLAGLDEVERSDFMFRDTNRVVCLVTLGRTAIDQSDAEGARAAYHQAMAHIRGRPRTLAGGALFVQALAGLARITRDHATYDEACARHATRDEFDFSFLWLCDDHVTCADLATAATALGRDADVRAFLEQAEQASPGRSEPRS